MSPSETGRGIGREAKLLLALSLALFAVATQLPDVSHTITRHFERTQERPIKGSGSLPVLSLGVAMRDFMLLDGLRQAALERGLLFRSSNDMVSALLSHDGRHQKVMVRLKGDDVDHFSSLKWSWRVHVGGDGHVLGMRRFSLQAPDTRTNKREALVFSHLRQEGLLAPRYEFVNLWVNGSDYGVMALEEHFSKELLESQGRREGVIVRFDEDEFWQDRGRNDKILGVGRVGPQKDLSWRMARVRPFREKVIAKSPLLQRQAKDAIGMLRALQAKRLAPSSVFDVDAMGRFLAVNELWGYWHGVRWHNLRFYLNPITYRLEPIGFDITSQAPAKFSLFRHPAVIFARVLMSDPEIYRAYREHLARFLDPASLGQTVAKLLEEEKVLVAELRPEYEVWVNTDQYLSKQVRRLTQGENPIPSWREIVRSRPTGRGVGPVLGEEPYPVVVQANLIEVSGNRAVLELASVLREDVQITELSVGSEVLSSPLSSVADVKIPIRLVASSLDLAPEFVRIEVPHSLLGNPSLVSGKAVVASQPNHAYAFTAQSYVEIAGEPPTRDRDSLVALLKRHPFLRWNGSGFSIPPGRFRVNEPLIIPRRLVLEQGKPAALRPSLKIAAGTRLEFGRDAFLLSYGACEMIGSAAQPIRLTGIAGKSWRGLAVLGARQPSRLEHVEIENTRATGLGNWQLTGGTTFYETKVTLDRVQFIGSEAEDALNLVRSSFFLDRVRWQRVRSDALDIDFSKGRIERAEFVSVGGDAIDLSGSEVFARDIAISKVGDKGVSVGEKSRLQVEDIRLRNVAMAIVSKDLSQTVVDRIELRDIGRVAFMAYQKKPEYGPASLAAAELDFDDSAKLAVVQYGSQLRVEGEEIAVSDVDVDRLYGMGPMSR